MSVHAQFEAYFDFDNTITSFDVVDDIIGRFSIDEHWRQVEEDWVAGRIGSLECLQRQFERVRVSAADFRHYLLGLRIDPAFVPILNLLRSHGVEPVIVSDGFRSVISTVLENNGAHGVRIYSNDMTLDGDRPVLAFPHHNVICSACGNCKTSHLMRQGRPTGTRKIYVGDGKSDICPAGFCEVLFAKDSLLRHYAPLRPDCIAFEELSTVLHHLSLLLK